MHKNWVVCLLLALSVAGCNGPAARNVKTQPDFSAARPKQADGSSGFKPENTAIASDDEPIHGSRGQAQDAPYPLSAVFQVYRNGKPTRLLGRELNGTTYLPVAAVTEDETQPPLENGYVQLPDHTLDVPRSQLATRAGQSSIVPPLVEENGRVWAPVSYFRNREYRIEVDPVAYVVTVTKEIVRP